jgi:tetratricopeptide (TPR) repeat protein
MVAQQPMTVTVPSCPVYAHEGTTRARSGSRHRHLWTLLLLLAAQMTGPLAAAGELAARWDSFAPHYDEDLARLDRLRDDLDQAVRQHPTVAELIALAHVSFLCGEFRAATSEDRLRAFEQGRSAAARAVELDPSSARAHFWNTVNTGKAALADGGVLRRVFLVPTIKREIRRTLELDPGFAPGYQLAGAIYSELPSLLGGDFAYAEKLYRSGLALDPALTGARVGLGQVLTRTGQFAEARRELTRVLGETAPRSPAEWTLRDAPEARRLLATLPPEAP